MDRRRFLQHTGLGLAATSLGLAAWPGFLSRAFGDDAPADPKARADELRLAIARARRDGKPLLVLVVPTTPDDVYVRGLVFGELINHGGASVLDDLLVCELACATLEETRLALRIDVKVEPAMLVIELDADGSEFLATKAIDVPARPASAIDEPEDEAAIRARIALAAKALHDGVYPTPESLARRAERNREALGAAACTAIADGLAGASELAPDQVRRGAAQVVIAAMDGGAEPKTRARAALDLAGAALVKARPAGAQWARSAGCGITIEGDTNPRMVACGMGRVPKLSQRFLHFYTKP